MPFIISIPPSRSNTSAVELSKEGLVIDSRVIKWDGWGVRFQCKIEGNTLTIKKVRKNEGLAQDGWPRDIYFRIYDPSIEKVPVFDSSSYSYHGLDHERAPVDVEEVVVEPSVKVIKECAFLGCKKMKRCIMGNNVEMIEKQAFAGCASMKVIRLSRSLWFIGEFAFECCKSIDILFLPPNVEEIQKRAFQGCKGMRILVLPSNIDLQRVGNDLVRGCRALLTTNAVQYDRLVRATNDDQVNHWVKHRYDHLTLLRLCADPNVRVRTIHDFIQEHGTVPFYQTDDDHGLTPLHILARYNANVNLDAIMTCFDNNPCALFAPDAEGLTPLDYFWADDEVDIIVHLIQGLCINWYMPYVIK